MNPDKVFLKNRLHEYLAKMSDATYEELAELKKRVCKGNDPYDNPFWVCDESGSPMDFISACKRQIADAMPEHSQNGNLPER